MAKYAVFLTIAVALTANAISLLVLNQKIDAIRATPELSALNWSADAKDVRETGEVGSVAYVPDRDMEREAAIQNLSERLAHLESLLHTKRLDAELTPELTPDEVRRREEQLTEDEEQAVADELVGLNEQFFSDSEDDPWTSEMNTDLQEVISSSDALGEAILDAECRSGMCRVVAAPGSNPDIQMLELRHRLQASDQLSNKTISLRTKDGETVFFLLRDGFDPR